jgi:hypothetical protein
MGISLRLPVLAAICCSLPACSAFLEQKIPGIFYDVHLTEPPAPSLCFELATSVAVQAKLTIASNDKLAAPLVCQTILRDETQALVVQVVITGDQVRNMLFVDVRQLGGRPLTVRTQELGEALAQIIHQRFPSNEVTPGKRFADVL